MASQTPDYKSVSRHVHECVEKSRSCLSLYQLSLDAVAVTLWKTLQNRIRPDKFDESDDEHDFECDDECANVQTFLSRNPVSSEEMQMEVLNEIKEFIPEMIFTDLDSAFTLKISQICAAVEFGHESEIEESINYFWTSRGSLDKPATFHDLIKRKILNGHSALKAACLYCLEDDVINLWDYDKIKMVQFSSSREYDELLVAYWTSFVIAGRKTSSDKIKKIIQHSVANEHETAVKYFWNKLNLKGRDRVLTKWKKRLHNSLLIRHERLDIDFFFITNATESQRLSLMESHLDSVLFRLVFTSKPEAKLFFSTAIKQMSLFIDDGQRKLFFERWMHSTIIRPIIFCDDLISLWNTGTPGWRSMMIREKSFPLIELLTRCGGQVLISMFKNVTKNEKLQFLLNEMSAMNMEFLRNHSKMEKFLPEFLQSEDSIQTFERRLAEYQKKNVRKVSASEFL